MKNVAFVLCVLGGALGAACSGDSAPSSPSPVDGGGEPVDATAGHAPVAAPMGVAPDTADGYDGLDDADLNGGPEIANASSQNFRSQFRVRNLSASCSGGADQVNFTWSLPQREVYGIRIRVGLIASGKFRSSSLWTDDPGGSATIWHVWFSAVGGSPGTPLTRTAGTITKESGVTWPETNGSKTRFIVQTKRWVNSRNRYVWGPSQHNAKAWLNANGCS